MLVLNWRELEARIPLDELPKFHRAFLQTRGIDMDNMPLRRIQQTVERELNKLIVEGRAQRIESDILIDGDVLKEVWIPDQTSV
jgi:hypothetical protein